MTARPAARARSVLELWHPSGAPARRLGLGAAAPAQDGGDGPVDFALVAPGAGELDRRWLERAITQAAARLDAGAVLCVVVPRRWRALAERRARAAGAVPLGTVLMVPPWPATAHAVSLDPASLRDAAARDLGLRPAAAAAAGALVSGRAGRTLASRLAPGCALLATRPPAHRPLRWLAALDGAAGPCVAAARARSRGDARVAVVLRFAPGGRAPQLVAKVGLDAGGLNRVARERAALASLGDAARAAGAVVPRIVATATPGTLATSALAGRPASALLARDAGRAAAILDATCRWLGGWTAATATPVVAARPDLRRLLLEPAERVAAAQDTPAMAGYLAALRSLADRLEARTLTLAAAHNDLTMSNVLVAGDAIGVVDWESADAAGLPLTDLWYALADGVARAGGVTPAQAVTALVGGATPLAARFGAVPDAHARALALDADEALLCFHACWLLHAANELERGATQGAFATVVRTVAAARLRWPAARGGP